MRHPTLSKSCLNFDETALRSVSLLVASSQVDHTKLICRNKNFSKVFKMAEKIVDNKDCKIESFRQNNDPTLIRHPSEINSSLCIDTQLGSDDHEAIILDTINNDSVSRKSEEMPNEHESTDIESGIQNTDQIEQLPFSPADEIVSDSNSSEGNCNCIRSIYQINRCEMVKFDKSCISVIEFSQFLVF